MGGAGEGGGLSTKGGNGGRGGYGGGAGEGGGAGGDSGQLATHTCSHMTNELLPQLSSGGRSRVKTDTDEAHRKELCS